MTVETTEPPAPAASAGRGKRRWLLLYNCQAQGLTYCLGLLGHDLRIDGYEVPTVRANVTAISRMLGNYERVLVLPEVLKIQGFDIAEHPQVRVVPSFVFSGYHPDMFRLGEGSGLRQGPLGNFHSLLAYCGWRAGREAGAAASLFRDTSFEALGYFARWPAERQALLDRFASAGLDLSREFPAWTRSGPFMHNPIHPHMVPLRDLARKLLQEAGVVCRETTLLPHDNLTAGPVFPVYPGLATRLGIAGGFDFKVPGRYEILGLDEFVALSFAAFDRFPDAQPAMEDARRVAFALDWLTDHA